MHLDFAGARDTRRQKKWKKKRKEVSSSWPMRKDTNKLGYGMLDIVTT